MKRVMLFLNSIVLLVVGCVQVDSPYVEPGDPGPGTGPGGRTTGITVLDAKMYATYLVDELLGSDMLAKTMREQWGAERPLLAVEIKNDTYQLSASDKIKQAMYDSLQMRLIKSGRFAFIDRGEQDKIGVDDVIEIDDGYTAGDSKGLLQEPAARRADYVLTAVLSEFRESDERQNECYYTMTVKLLNKRTRETDWVGVKDIRKVSSRPFVGW